MRQEKKFLRQCVSCGEYKDKQDLIRITKEHNSSEIIVNTEKNIYGRSVYVCKNENCVNILLKKKKIEHYLKAKTPENIKVKLATVLTK